MTDKLTLYGSVLEDAARRFEIHYEEFTLQRRFPRLVRARQWVWMVLHDTHGWSFNDIARTMGFKNHTTILHGARKARKQWLAANTHVSPTYYEGTGTRWSSCANASTVATIGTCSMPPTTTPSSFSVTEERLHASPTSSSNEAPTP